MNTTKSKMYAGLAVTGLLSLVTVGSASADIVLPPITTVASSSGETMSIYEVNGFYKEEIPVYVNSGYSTGNNMLVTGSMDKNNESDDVKWTTTDTNGLTGSTGRSIIKGGDVGSTQAPITNVTFSLFDDSLFNDAEFSLNPETNTVVYFTLSGLFEDGTTASWSSDTQSGLTDFVMIANSGNVFQSITITVNDGPLMSIGGDLEQTKQWAVSFAAPVPIPAAAWLFGSAIVGFAGIGYRRKAAV